MKAETTVSRFRSIIANRFGLHFEKAQGDFLASLIENRCAERGAAPESYLSGLAADEAELAILASHLTVGETYFFRNIEQFSELWQRIRQECPDVVSGARELRVLSAGCSSGEEPFSIAMLLRTNAPAAKFTIHAVDINPAALARAAKGCFSRWSFRETPSEMLDRWFVQRGIEVELDPDIRSSVRFEQASLVDDRSSLWGEGRYDVIFCRNAIMYLAPEIQRKVVALIAKSLTPGGYLFLGHAETMRGLSDDFELVQSGGTFYYRRSSAPVHSEVTAEIGSLRFARPLDPSPRSKEWFKTIGDATHRIAGLAAQPIPVVSAMLAEPLEVPSHGHLLGLVSQERFAEALAALEQESPERQEPALLLMRATVLLQTGQLKHATLVCRSLMKWSDHHASTNYILGLCCELGGNTRDALLHYDLAIGADLTFAMPRLRRGMLARRYGLPGSARVNLGQASELLEAETAERVILFGGGLTRAALTLLCVSELASIKVAA